MVKRLLLSAVAAFAVLAASGCSSLHGLSGTGNLQYIQGNGTAREIAVQDRTEPVDFTGKDLDGKPLSLAAMRGKPTVVTVWWAGCAPCHKEAPLLVGANRQLSGRAHFVGIDVRDAGTAAPKAFESQFGIDWPSFYSPGGEAILAFPGTLTPVSIPATLVLDARGRVAGTIIGAVPSQRTLVEMVRDVMRSG